MGILDRTVQFGATLRRSAESVERDTIDKTFESRSEYYDLLERYYSNEIYERADISVEAIKGWAGLPRHIRPISLIAKRAVDWWTGQVYPGTWTTDGMPTSNGVPNRLPYDEDVNTKLRLAVQQFYSWGNASQFLGKLVHHGAKLGNVLAEVEVHWSDTPSGHKVYPVIVHPRYVVDLELSARGDIQHYRLAIPRFDKERNTTYKWGKLVTKDYITTFYDDRPHDYDGNPATVPNPYGFVAAVWVPHQTASSIYGASAIDGIIPTLDEYHGLLSTVDDFIHRFIAQGVILETPDPDTVLAILNGQSSSPTSTRLRPQINKQRQSIAMFPMPIGTKSHPILSNLGLEEADPHIARIMLELEKALPEIALDEKLLDMDNVTKPGATTLVHRVQQKLTDVVDNYDSHVIKLGQMGVAIAGFWIEEMAWGLTSQLTDQQKKFVGFGLDSYSKGKLDFGLIPRTLIPHTLQDMAAEALLIESIKTPTGLRHIGKTDEEIYGKNNIPEQKLGILEERQMASAPATGNSSFGTSGDLVTAFGRIVENNPANPPASSSREPAAIPPAIN